MVVPSRDRPVRLRWLLNALEEQTLERGLWEVVVVHDSTLPETERLLREHPLAAAGRLRHLALRPGSAGPGPKLNLGWREARAPLIAFTEDVCRSPAEWLERALVAARRNPGAIVQGATVPDPDERDLLGAPGHRTRRIAPPTSEAEACNIVYPRAALARLGGFDEDLRRGEDADLAARARRAGIPLVAAPEVLTYHAVVALGLPRALRRRRRPPAPRASPPAAGDPLRVALLSPCFWPEVRRGGERLVRDLADGLLARGHRPRLITSHPGRPSRAVEDGLPITRHWRPPEAPLRRRHYESYLTHVPLSYLSLRLGDDDVAHAVYPTDALAAARWSLRTGRPAILSYLGIPSRTGLTWKRYQLEVLLRALEGCAAVVALSQTVARAFRRWLGVEARVIHPGVDLSVFRPGTRSDSPAVFCGAALDEPRKRVGLLVAAFEQVRRERPGARLVLSRPRDPALAERLVANAPGVELRDVDERSALARAYGEAWVSVLPSHDEAFGLVLLEAMACGTPGVGPGRDGVPEVIDRDEVGRLFYGDDECALARAILEALELAEDPATAHACRTRAEQFSTDRTTEEYLRLYRELLERGPAPARPPVRSAGTRWKELSRGARNQTP